MTAVQGENTNTSIHVRGRIPNCDQCGNAFIQASDLTKHKLIICPLFAINMERYFVRQVISESIYYKLNHTGEKPYVFDQCGKAFVQADSLSRHKLTHTCEKLDLSDLCGKAFILAVSQHPNTSIQVRSLISMGTWECISLGK